MSQVLSQPILDYASPLVRRPLRMADKSILTFFADEDGRRVVESLQGKNAAMAAIIFSAGSMTTLGVAICGCYQLYSSDWFAAMSVYAIFALATSGFILAVIYSSWQETILKTRADSLLLTFKNPFKTIFHQWAWEQIRLVRVMQELDDRTQRLVYEVHIETWPGQFVKLFRGHEAAALSLIAENIDQYLTPVKVE